MSVTILLREYRRRTGDNDTVELIDEAQRKNDLQFCHHDDCTGNPDGKDAEYTIDGTPYCGDHTMKYLESALVPFREIEALMAQANAQGLTVHPIDDGRIDTMRRCQTCHNRAGYIVEGEEHCLPHAIALLKYLLG